MTIMFEQTQIFVYNLTKFV